MPKSLKPCVGGMSDALWLTLENETLALLPSGEVLDLERLSEKWRGGLSRIVPVAVRSEPSAFLTKRKLLCQKFNLFNPFWQQLIGKDIATASNIVAFMKGVPDEPRCGFSTMAVRILQICEVKLRHAVDVLEDAEKKEAFKVFSDWPTVPQLYVAGPSVGSCDIDARNVRSLRARNSCCKKRLPPSPKITTGRGNGARDKGQGTGT